MFINPPQKNSNQINLRVEEMFSKGLVEEVKRAPKKISTITNSFTSNRL